jgi:hypothetical protein
LPRGFLEIVTELTFEDEIYSFNFLFFSELLTVANQCLAPAHVISMLSRRLSTTFFNRARGFVTTITLQEKLTTFTAAQTAHRISIPSHLILASGLSSRRKSLQAGAGVHPEPALRPLG